MLGSVLLKTMQKYRNKKTVIDNITFDSKAESRRYLQLKELQQIGIISDLKMQELFVLVPKQSGERAVKYLADFTYIENGIKVTEDVKSKATITPSYIIKRKLMLSVHGIKIKQVIM